MVLLCWKGISSYHIHKNEKYFNCIASIHLINFLFPFDRWKPERKRMNIKHMQYKCVIQAKLLLVLNATFLFIWGSHRLNLLEWYLERIWVHIFLFLSGIEKSWWICHFLPFVWKVKKIQRITTYFCNIAYFLFAQDWYWF